MLTTTDRSGQIAGRPETGAAAWRSRTGSIAHVMLRLDPARVRRFHHELAVRLVAELRVGVTWVAGQGGPSAPPSIDLLFAIERLVYRLRGPRLSDRLPLDELDLANTSAQPPDLIIDLCGGAAAHDCPTLRLLFDGTPDESVLFGSLVAGRMPTIEIEDVQSGLVLASGTPCADNAGTTVEAFEFVLARAVTLVASAVRSLRHPTPRSRLLRHSQPSPSVAMFAAKRLAHSIARSLYHLCCHAPHWRTAWRFVQDDDLWQTGSLAGTSWNVIPDPGFRFYADPFPFVHAGQSYVFVEDYDHRGAKAVISVVPFDACGPSGPARPVLEEPWHLSYPFVFAIEGHVWMIPESSANRTVELYRADPFPHRWVREATLLTGIEASDATLIRHGGYFWMFVATRDGAGSWSDTLSIFRARDFRGPWTPHPRNPVLIDQASARPAGAIVERNGVLWRPVQDCTHGYGTGIGLAEITRLDSEHFEQEVHTVLRAPVEWPGRRFHTLNRAGQLECIDGSAHSPRNVHLARMLEGWSGRREAPASRS
jgi:hypothetical protein